MSATTKKDYITFANGISTEGNYIKEEEGTCSELSNFKINKDGSIEKRGGFLPTYSPIAPSLGSDNKPQSYLWKNVAGNPEDSFYVIKQGLSIMFFNANQDFSTASKEVFSINLSSFLSNGHNTGDKVKVKIIDGEGFLFIAGKFIEPLIVNFDKETKTMIAKEIKLEVRDYIGIDDNIKDVTEYPRTYTDTLAYNLTNQGFSESDVAQFYTENGFLPSKVDVPKYFKYIKISTDYKAEDPILPEEIFDYKLSIENNFGTSRAPTGRKILDVFKRKREVDTSQVKFYINSGNTHAFRKVGGKVIISFRTNRLPSFAIGTNYHVDIEQDGFDVTFPAESNAYVNTQIGVPMSSIRDNPVVVDWERHPNQDLERSVPIFEGSDIDAPWDAVSTMTESEYKSNGFRYNDCIMVRNTGDINEYILISNNNQFLIDFFKENLIDVVGGKMITEFDTPGSWNLSEHERGYFMKITTNANKDNLYFNRYVTQIQMQQTYWYNGLVSDGVNAIERSIAGDVVHATAKIKPFVSGGNDKYILKFVSDDVAELHISDAFEYIGNASDKPAGFDAYRFNHLPYNNNVAPEEQRRRQVMGYEDIVSQLKISHDINQAPVEVSSDEEDFRPEATAFYANRLFYSSYDSDTYSNHIFFSQMEDLENNVGKCYAKNDPTNEYQNALLDTDGGYISLPEADNILNLVVVKDKLIVFARNSIYAVFGEPFFKATNYAFRKVADIGIVSPDAYTIVGETIVFASDDGLYNFNIDEMNGDLLSNNFSNEKIKSLYTSLTKEQKENIRLDYNPYEKKMLIMFNKSTALAPDYYDTILNYDFDLKAFYEYNIGQYGNLQVVDFFDENIYNKSKPNSLLYYDNVTGGYGTLTESETSFKDFSNSNAPITCALESNYINFNDVIRNKRVRKLEVYADNINDSHCEAFIKYDSSILSSSKKWSKAENIFRLQSKTNGDVHMHQQVCRGDGLFFKIRMESNQDKPCSILGWTLTVEGNQQI